jgi:alkylated DNA repair dioxygenase AlkB
MSAENGWLLVDPTVERLDLGEGSWVDVVRRLVPRGDEVHDRLVAAARWEQGQVFRYERWIDSPRLMAAYAAGTQPAIDAVDTWLRRRYRVAFTAPALALYRDERDSVAYHRDRELRWLDDTVIAVLTFGARRPWLMKPLTGRRNDLDDYTAGAIDLAPGSGDLLVMGGTTQARWLHAVPKVRGRCRPRISVQWRYTSRRGARDTNPSFYAPRHFSKRQQPAPAQRRNST